MVRVHPWPSDRPVPIDALQRIDDLAGPIVDEVRDHLPALHDDLYVLVHSTSQVIPETGSGGFTLGPQVIRFDLDPDRDVVAVVEDSLRATLFHECHHAVRLQRRPQEMAITDWPMVAVFEGLASVFEDDPGGHTAPWRTYDPEVIGDWAHELFAQPVDERWWQWKVRHPDGRRSIAYRVGSWLADRAIERSGRSAADLVWASPDEVLDLAGFTTDG